MKYIYSDNLGEETSFDSLRSLKDILDKPYQSWQEGSGDSAIQINDEQRLIFFKIKEGFFIMQHPDYLAPKIISDSLKTYKHCIGGQEMIISNTNLCDKSTAYSILKVFIETGKLSEEFEWVDYYEELNN